MSAAARPVQLDLSDSAEAWRASGRDPGRQIGLRTRVSEAQHPGALRKGVGETSAVGLESSANGASDCGTAAELPRNDLGVRTSGPHS